MEAITAFLKSLAAALGFLQKRQELNNSPEMQANAVAKTDQTVTETATKAVAANDLEEIRKLSAE